MPGLNGIELCAIIERKHPYCHIPLFSGQPSTNELVEKARPVDPDEPLDKLTSLHAGSR
jgi:hypothetical protein